VALLSPARARANGRGEDRAVGPYDVAMDVQPITYRGRIVAACTRECFLLANDLAYRAPGDPELVFVVAMCAYATDVARGLLPGTFDDADAHRYARAFLVPEELLERQELDVDRAAAALGLPADELRSARPRGHDRDLGCQETTGRTPTKIEHHPDAFECRLSDRGP
jgi:hypothetical protein